MFEQAFFWLFLNFFTIAVLAFFSMEEMASVSFNKIRLQYLIKQGSHRAEWLSYLLQNPSRLFGTTLIGVNVATIVGSECSRQFHQAIGINPDFAPLSQVIIVIIFGELAPLFAARSYSEHVALLGVPFIYIASKLLAPFIWILGLLSKLANYLTGGVEPHPELLLSKDELQRIIEEQDEEKGIAQEKADFNLITRNIFRVRDKTVKHVMTSLTEKPLISSQITIEKLRKSISDIPSYLLVYHKEINNIIGIVFIRDLIRAPALKKVRDYCQSPWFIAEKTPLFQIIKQFRRNSEHVAIVLDDKGKATGLINFDDILEEVFTRQPPIRSKHGVLIDRTLPGNMTLADFNLEFQVNLTGDKEETLSEMAMRILEHHPEVGETLLVPPFEFTVKEATLLEVKTFSVKTIVV